MDVHDAGQLAGEEIAQRAEDRHQRVGEGRRLVAEECDDGEALLVVVATEGREGRFAEPLAGATDASGPSAMVNCIGVMPSRDAVLAVPGAHLHDYGKSPRRGRKLGHVTAVAADDAELAARLDALLPAIPADG